MTELSIKTEEDILYSMASLKKEIAHLKEQNKSVYRRMDDMQTAIDAEAETSKRLCELLQCLQSKEPEIKTVTTRVEVLDKKSAAAIQDNEAAVVAISLALRSMPVPVVMDDVLELIRKHVTIDYVNKLYKKRVK